MKPVLTVTLNAAIDETYFISGFKCGTVNRVEKKRSQAGGKGINVARAIRQLGGNVLATGLVGGTNGESVINHLEQEGIPHQFYKVAGGQSRICLAIINVSNGEITEILEQGIRVTEKDLFGLQQLLETLITKDMYVVFSGSLPQGCNLGHFKSLTETVHKAGAKLIMDTSGPALRMAIEQRPFLVKPNEDEIRQLTGSRRSIEKALIMMADQGVEVPLVTLGKKGAIALLEGKFIKITPPQVDVINTVGSGDAFLGGLLFGLCNDYDFIQSFKLAAASGASNATTETAGQINAEMVQDLAGKIRVETRSFF